MRREYVRSVLCVEHSQHERACPERSRRYARAHILICRTIAVGNRIPETVFVLVIEVPILMYQY